MNERIIERVSRFVIPTSKELFEKFCAEINSAKLPEGWDHDSEWTEIMLGIFDKIGRSFGYMPKKEWMRLDQTWEVRLPDISTIVLALEYENTSDLMDLLDDELQKLLDTKAHLKLLMYYPLDIEKNIGEIGIKIRSQRIKLPAEKLLVISGTIDSKAKNITFQAYEFDAEGESTFIDRCRVPYTEK